MKSIHFHALFLIGVIGLAACQNKKTNPDLTSIELLRGEITLCGGDQFGEVNFSFDYDQATKKQFDLALALLHSFEYDEAEKAFVKIIDSNPSCAMAYWGIAMSIYHSLWKAPDPKELEKGSKILKIAESVPQTEIEKDYLEAIGAYYKDWQTEDHETRALRMEKKMEELYMKYEEDTEAAIFYALALRSTSDPSDKEYRNQIKAGKILESIFPEQPNHPGIAHYLIHNYDYPELAHLALSTARKYAQIAPASAHAQHMPSHIFTRLGYWDESISSNLNSASSAVCYAEQSGYDGHWSKEIHAIAYLVYAYLQMGDNASAMEQYDYLKTMDKIYPVWDHRAAAYPVAAIPARIAMENKNWQEASKIEIQESNIDWDLFPWEKANLQFARTMGAINIGNIESAETELSNLQTLYANLIELDKSYESGKVVIQIKISQAWLNYAKGNANEALTLMKEAVDLEDNTDKHPVTPGEILPACELLGDLLLKLNKPSEALVAYEKNLELNPNRFNGLYGAAIAAKRMKDHEKATKYFAELLNLADGVESDRSELAEAKVYINQVDTNI